MLSTDWKRGRSDEEARRGREREATQPEPSRTGDPTAQEGAQREVGVEQRAALRSRLSTRREYSEKVSLYSGHHVSRIHHFPSRKRRN